MRAHDGTVQPAVTERRDVTLPARDGVRLAGNLYMPDVPGRFPGLLMYTPYLKDGPGGRGPAEVLQRFLARHGYACLTLDRRGFGASEGRAGAPFSTQEREDGTDALAWMAEQPWCDGATGMWGISYGADTALSVASSQPSSLRAIVPIHGTDDEFMGVCYPHGCRGGLWSEIDWGFRMLGLQLFPPLRHADGRAWIGVWRDRLESVEPWLFTWHTIPPDRWAAWRTDASLVRAAAYMVSAWHDCYPGEMLRMYGQLPGPKRLLIGPWKHELPDRAVNQPIGFAHEMVRWFDHWLKGRDTGVMEELPLTVYAQPDGWRRLASWPPSGRQATQYYLQRDGLLGREPVSDGTADRYRVDPSVGLHHLPWDWTTPPTDDPPDISPDDHRALAYTTAPLGADLRIAGAPEVLLYLSADQPDFPLAAWLSDVSPSGFSTMICQGWIRPAHVVGGGLDEGTVYGLRLPMFPALYRVPAGHRLRLAIAGSHFPVLIPAPVNPTLTLHRSRGRCSALSLPIDDVRQSGGGPPIFTAPLRENPEAVVVRETDNTLSRDLSGRHAAHRSQHREVYTLEGGTRLRVDMETTAAIDADRPREIRLAAVRTLALDRPDGAIVVRTNVTETFDLCHVAAEITVDGRAFFERSWNLELGRSEWSVREKIDAAATQRAPRR